MYNIIILLFGTLRSILISSPGAPKYSYKNHFMLAQIGLTRFLPDDVANVQFQLNIYKKNQKHTGDTAVLHS